MIIIWGAKSLLLEGLCWRIGTRCNVPVWGAVWIPDGKFYRQPELQHNSNYMLHFRDLIDHENRTWCEAMVIQTLSPSDAANVLNIPLCPGTITDSYMWPYTKQGVYTVKSGYWLGIFGRQDAGQQSNPLWDSVWRMDVPPKLRVFAWRAMSNSLSVKHRLVSRKVLQSATCDRCLGEDETIWHALVTCPSSWVLWVNTPFEQLFPLNSAMEVQIAAQLVVNIRGVTALADFFTLLWVAWTVRNQYQFEVRASNAPKLLIGFKNMVDEYRLGATATRVTGPSTPIVRQWNPPPMGLVKLNADAAILGSDGVGLTLAPFLTKFALVCLLLIMLYVIM